MNVQAGFTNFEYEQGSGPSNSQSFAINYEGLTNAIEVNTISPISCLEFSLDSTTWSSSLNTDNTYSGTGTLNAFTRLKSGLSSSLYSGQFYVSFPQDGDVIPVNYNAAVKSPQQNVTIAGVYAPLRTFFGYPSASQYVSNPQEIEVHVKNATFNSMSISITSSYQLCVDRNPTSPIFFTSSLSESIITASGITNDYSLRFWMRLRSGSVGSVDTTLTVKDENNNTVATASIVGRRYIGESSIDCWNEASTINILWQNNGAAGSFNTRIGLQKYIYNSDIFATLMSQSISEGVITYDDYAYSYQREITSQQRLHARLITPSTVINLFSPQPTSASIFYPNDVARYLNNTNVPTTPTFVPIFLQILEPELVSTFSPFQTQASGIVYGPSEVTGLEKIKYVKIVQLISCFFNNADGLANRKWLYAINGPNTAADSTIARLNTPKLPEKTIFHNAYILSGLRNNLYYPKIFNSGSLGNTIFESRNFQYGRILNNIQEDGFINSDTVRITLDSILLPETTDLSIYARLQDLTLTNLTGSLIALYLPQNLTKLSLSGSPISYSINQELPYSGAINVFNVGQSGSTNITNYDSFISNLRFTTSSQFTLTGVTTSSLPAIPSVVTASVVGGGPFNEFNFRTFYTSGQPTMSIATINGTGMTYTPGTTVSFDSSVGDLKTVTITNMTSSYDVDLSNLVSASINITSGVRNVTLPISYADDNEVITINSTNLENIYVPINANYSGSRNTTLGLIPGFSIDTLDLSGSYITNLTVSSSGYFNSFRRLLGGFETIRNYNLQFSSFDAGGVEYFLSQVSSSGPRDFATSGSTTGSIVDSTKAWTPNQYTSSTIRIFDNSGNSYNDIITSNTTSSVNFGRMVAGGVGTNTLAYSNDRGLTWVGSGVSTFNPICRGITYNGTRFVAVGDGSSKIAHSIDGINWTSLGNIIFTGGGQGYAVAWNGTRFVAVGSGTNLIAHSTDGITWTGLGATVTNGYCTSIAWNGTRWIVGGIGTNTLAYSDDGGLTWVGLGSSVLSGGCYGVAWNGTRFVAVGQGTNAIAHSTDGITWTGVTGASIFSSSGNAVAWNGTRFVAVGIGTNTIAYSDDGITWTGVIGSTSIFSVQGHSVAWNGTRFVAGGEGTNALAYSTDGINWTGLGQSTFTSNGRGITSTTPFASLTPNIGIAPTTGTQYIVPNNNKSIDLRNQRNGLQITPAISSSVATLQSLGWTVNI